MGKNFQQNNGLNKNNDNIKNSLLMFTYIPRAPDDVMEGFFKIIFEYFNFNACIK